MATTVNQFCDILHTLKPGPKAVVQLLHDCAERATNESEDTSALLCALWLGGYPIPSYTEVMA